MGIVSSWAQITRILQLASPSTSLSLDLEAITTSIWASIDLMLLLVCRGRSAQRCELIEHGRSGAELFIYSSDMTVIVRAR